MPLKNLNSNQVYQIVLRTETNKQKSRLKNIIDGQKYHQKKNENSKLSGTYKPKFNILHDSHKIDEPSKKEIKNDENSTVQLHKFNKSLPKFKSSNIFIEFSTQTSQKSLTNFYENKNLTEILETKILELIEKNEKLENEFKHNLLEKNHLEKENIFLIKEVNILDEKQEKTEEKYHKKINNYKKKIRDLEVELLESHDNIIDLEKKMKILTLKHLYNN